MNAVTCSTMVGEISENYIHVQEVCVVVKKNAKNLSRHYFLPGVRSRWKYMSTDRSSLPI